MTAALLEARQQFDADSLASWLSPCVDFEHDAERRNQQLAAMGKPFVSVAPIARLPQPESAPVAPVAEAASKDTDAAGDTITLTKGELADMIAAHLGDAGDAGSVPLPRV